MSTEINAAPAAAADPAGLPAPEAMDAMVNEGSTAPGLTAPDAMVNGGSTATAGPEPPMGGEPGKGHKMHHMWKKFFMYKPSFLMALTGAILFSITCIIHTVQFIKTKCWYFSAMPQAALVVAISSIARAVLALSPKSTSAYMVFEVTQKIAGAMTGIAIIFTFTRLVWWVTPNDKRVWSTAWAPPGFISFQWAGLFLIPDLVKIIGNQAFRQGPKMRETAAGRHVEGAAWVFQMIAMAGFAVTVARFHFQASKWERQGDMAGRPAAWKALSWATIAAAGMFAARLIFQVVYFDTKKVHYSYPHHHEWVFWFYDQLPLLAIFFIYNVYHPGNYLPRNYTGFRLNRKRLLVIKGNGLPERSPKGAYAISGPKDMGGRGKDEFASAKVMDVEGAYVIPQ